MLKSPEQQCVVEAHRHDCTLKDMMRRTNNVKFMHVY